MHLGLDLGTSGLKGLLIDDEQVILAEAASPMVATRPYDGWSEQRPLEWISAAKNVLNMLHRKVGLSSLQSIGLSGQMHGATLLDKSDRVLRPCILWNDTRSHAEAAAMDIDPEFRIVSGNIVFPGFTAPKLRWVKKHEPQVFDQVAKVLLPKDFLRLWLTGDHVTDMSDAAGTGWLNTGQRSWSDGLLAKTALRQDQMPRLVEGSEISGSLRQKLRNQFGITQEVVVAGGGGDNAASGIGAGVSKAGDAFASLGTSGVLFAACDGYSPDAASAVHTFCHAIPNMWHQMGVILSATDSLNWYCRLVGKDVLTLIGQLGTLQAPGKPVFLPYLGGERTPHNNANARGAFIGLEHVTSTTAGARAVVEGVVHAFRDNFNVLSSTGTKIERIMAVGGGSNSDYWLEALATSLNMPIDVPVSGDFGGAFGAARLGMMAVGASDEIITRPPVYKTIQPNKDLIQAFIDAHEGYCEAYKMVKNLT
ncbi:MAG: xylulokinase [Gammaproteobacteria bacterium]|nr:xylulokinase [Gammaproteobacteria bacterium]